LSIKSADMEVQTDDEGRLVAYRSGSDEPWITIQTLVTEAPTSHNPSLIATTASSIPVVATHDILPTGKMGPGVKDGLTDKTSVSSMELPSTSSPTAVTSEIQESDKLDTNTADKYPCSECGKDFASNFALHRHRAGKHQIQKIGKQPTVSEQILAHKKLVKHQRQTVKRVNKKVSKKGDKRKQEPEIPIGLSENALDLESALGLLLSSDEESPTNIVTSLSQSMPEITTAKDSLSVIQIPELRSLQYRPLQTAVDPAVNPVIKGAIPKISATAQLVDRRPSGSRMYDTNPLTDNWREHLAVPYQSMARALEQFPDLSAVAVADLLANRYRLSRTARLELRGAVIGVAYGEQRANNRLANRLPDSQEDIMTVRERIREIRRMLEISASRPDWEIGEV
jgi:hypothetical protein